MPPLELRTALKAISTDSYKHRSGRGGRIWPLVRYTLLLLAPLFLTTCSVHRDTQNTGRTLHDFFAADAIVPVGFPMDTPIDAHVYATTDYTYLAPEGSAADDTMFVYTVSNTDNATEIIPLAIPGDSALSKRGVLAGMAADGNYICLLFWRALVVYQRAGPNGPFSNPRVIGLQYPYSSLRLFGDTCILSISRFANREYSSAYTYLGLMDLSTGKFRWERPFPDPDGIQFTYFVPRRPIDFTRREIAVADIAHYRINIYDYQGQLRTSLTRNPRNWSSVPDTMYRKYLPPIGRVPFNPKPHLDSLRPYVSSSSMIRLADFIDDTTLLVAWQSTHRYDSGILSGRVKVFFDIWRKNRDTWDLLAGDIGDFNPMPSDTFSAFNMMELSFDYTGAGAGYCYRFRPLPPMDLMDKTFQEITRVAESYMLEHDPKFSLVRFRIRQEY